MASEMSARNRSAEDEEAAASGVDRRLLLLLGAVALSGAAAAVMLVAGDRTAQQLPRLEREAHEAQASATRRQALRAENSRLEQQLLLRAGALPREPQVPELWEALSQAAVRTKVELLAIDPLPPPTMELPADARELTVEGSYLAVGQFMKEVVRGPRLVRIDHADLLLEDGRPAGRDNRVPDPNVPTHATIRLTAFHRAAP